MKLVDQSTCCCSSEYVWELLENEKGPRVTVWVGSYYDEEGAAKQDEPRLLAEKLEAFLKTL